MKNEEYINKNMLHCSMIAEIEEALIENVKDMQLGINVSSIGQLFESKIKELLDTFKVSDKPLSLNLIVIIESMYLYQQINNYINAIKGYVDSIIQAIQSKDENQIKEILMKKEIIEEKISNIGKKITEFDFENNLDEVLQSETYSRLNFSFSSDEAKRRCVEELRKVDYTPKGKEESTPKM